MSTRLGLEAWLIGTPDELTAALDALTHTGHAVETSHPVPLTGADTGRHRIYLRLSIPTRPGHTPPGAGAVIDLHTRRRTA